jgi:UPF0271 protein
LDSKEIVVDAAAFYAGIVFLSGLKCMTTSAVFDEVKHIRTAAIEGLMHSGNLHILDPDKKSINAITLAARKTGDIARLSIADISILALALERKTTLASDDYAVANVAATLGIRVVASSGKGIKEQRKYITYCSACGKAFSHLEKECPLCGNKLKRRYKKVTSG